jgi:hypothetical protein
MFYPNTDETALEVQGADPTTRQTALLYAASSDVFFEGVGKEERYDLKPGITALEGQRIIEKVQRSAYARKHWPRFYAAPMSVFTNDVSGIEKTFFYAISGEKFRGAYTRRVSCCMRSGTRSTRGRTTPAQTVRIHTAPFSLASISR